MNAVYQFKSVAEEQGKTSLFSIYCLNSKYKIHTFFSLSLKHIIFKNSVNWIFTILIITTLLAHD